MASNNAWSGKNQFNADVSLNSITSLTSDIYATALASTADTNAVSYNPSTKKLGYVALSSGSALLASNNAWSGTQYFGADTSFNSGIYINNLPYSSTDLSCVTYNPTTKKISYTTIPNLLPSINTWSAANTFSDTVNANNNLVLGGEAYYNYLQFPDSTIQYTAALSPTTLLTSYNTWTNNNIFQVHTTLNDVSINGTIQIAGGNLTFPNLPTGSKPNQIYFDSGTLKMSYAPIPTSLLGLNNIWTGKNTFVSDVSLNGTNLYFGNIPSSSDPNFIAYNSSTKQISYTPSLLGSSNTWSGSYNSFQNMYLNSQTLSLRTNTNLDYVKWVSGIGARLAGEYGGQLFTSVTGGGVAALTWSLYDVIVQYGNFTVGQVATGAGVTTGGYGKFNCYAPSYASDSNPTSWNNSYNLFSTTTSKDTLYSSAMAICQLSATENAIICKQPDLAFTNMNVVCNKFTVKINNSNFMVLDNQYICYWNRSGGGSSYAYIAPPTVTNLMFVCYRVSDNSTYGYFDATTGLWGSTSDERVKKDISPADLSLSKQFITDITPVTYRLINEEITCKNLGFIAQDVLKNCKTESQKNIVANWEKYEDAVAKGQEPMEEWEDTNDMDAEGKPKKKLRKMMLGVSTAGMIPEIVGCLKEMNKENEELKLQVESQQTQISQQQKQITELQSKYELLEDSVAMLLSKM